MNKFGKSFLKHQVGFCLAVMLTFNCTMGVVSATTEDVDDLVLVESLESIKSIEVPEKSYTKSVDTITPVSVVINTSQPVIYADEVVLDVGTSAKEVNVVLVEDVVLDTFEVPNSESGCLSYKFTWMDYKTITSKSSNQYVLQNSDECYTCPVTGIRMVGDRYCIAVGTGYASEIGTKINLVMANGSVIKCILGDVKSDSHTDETNRYHFVDGSVAEFIVDDSVFTSTEMYPEEVDGRIVCVEIIE